MFGVNKEGYEEQARWEAKHDIDALKCEEIGYLVLCEARKDNTTRLFIHRFDSIYDVYNKNGWWDIFTISVVPCKTIGFYICKINDFRIDKNGFLNMVVTPEKFLGAEVDADSDAWNYFFGSGIFTRKYRSTGHHKTRYNVDSLHQLFADDIDKIKNSEMELLGDKYITAEKKVAELIMDKYFSGEITLADIDKALDEKDDLEKLVDDLNLNVRRYGSDSKNKYLVDYPLLVKKLPVEEYGLCAGCYTTENTRRYLERKDYEYDHLKLGDETDILKRVEAVLLFWADIKAKEKEERKRKRKEKKTLL